MAKTVVGLIENADEAQVVVQELVDCGIERSAIGLMANDSSTSAGDQVTGGTAEGDDMAEGALKGAGTGAALGGVAGLLAGAAALAIPGFGPIIAAGPIAAALTGAGIGAVAGGGIGALIKQGVPEEDAKYYTEGVRRGGTLVTVQAESEDMADRAAAIMRDHGAINIEERAQEWRASGWNESATGAAQQSMNLQQQESMPRQEGEQVVPVVKEELQVGKRQVELGGVRVYSTVTETPVEETVRLREEHAEVERRPVDRPIGDADEVFKEQTIEVRETAEQPVVAKRGRVVEEVVVSKESTEREETVRDTVRETEVQVERMSGTGMGSRNAYKGPERRVHATAYQGTERRAIM